MVSSEAESEGSILSEQLRHEGLDQVQPSSEDSQSESQISLDKASMPAIGTDWRNIGTSVPTSFISSRGNPCNFCYAYDVLEYSKAFCNAIFVQSGVIMLEIIIRNKNSCYYLIHCNAEKCYGN